MSKENYWKIVLIIGVIFLSVWMFSPPTEKIKLGLDLQGGMHLILAVQTDDAIKVQTDQDINRLKEELNEKKIDFEKIYIPSKTIDDNGVKKDTYEVDKLIIEGIAPADSGVIEGMLKNRYVNWKYTTTSNGFNLSLKKKAKESMEELSVLQAIETVRRRVDKFGVAEPVIQQQKLLGDDKNNKIMVQLPGFDDKTRVKNLIQSSAMLEFKHVVAGPFTTEAEAEEERNNNSDYTSDELVVLPTNARRTGDVSYYVLKSISVVTGKDLGKANHARDEYNKPAVGLNFNADGAKKIQAYTSAHINDRLAIVLDKKVETAPRIETSFSYSARITGGYTYEQANDMILVLNSGALPASLKLEQTEVIGPSLGVKSIEMGFFAIMVGLIGVVLFMLLYYKLAGVNAAFALILNIVILLGILASFRAVLTLPGIAGILLTIGMAVDANVLVFERIKEDLRSGKSPHAAIEEGFQKAFITIFDANITTVIAAVFLFQFGTGPIKGFSVTLIIGVITSMFTAIFVSRVLFDIFYKNKKKLTKISI
jgi:preprotein translocase subunit SecD